MSAKIALQLYSVREALAKDFDGVVRKVAEMGYPAVEPAGFPGTTPAKAAKLFRELGLTVCSFHMFPPPSGPKFDEAVDTLVALGCGRIVSGYGPDDLKTMDGIKRCCDVLNSANTAVRARGFDLAVHNHWWEYEKVGDRYVYQVMLDLLDPTVLFELDTYWILTAGHDPAEIVKAFGKRAPLLHIKDGPATQKEPMQALGEGAMDIPSILKASAGSAEWVIVELDRVATDMMEAVAKSYRYLAGLVK